MNSTSGAGCGVLPRKYSSCGVRRVCISCAVPIEMAVLSCANALALAPASSANKKHFNIRSPEYRLPLLNRIRQSRHNNKRKRDEIDLNALNDSITATRKQQSSSGDKFKAVLEAVKPSKAQQELDQYLQMSPQERMRARQSSSNWA